VTALACALGLGVLLAYLGWREWLGLHRPLPPHEALKAEVADIRSDLDTVMAWAGAKRGQSDG
jgi:hypothetical protein